VTSYYHIISAVFTFLLALWCATPLRAEASKATVSVGAGVHVLSSLRQVCQRDSDVIGCSPWWPFVGIEVGGEYRFTDWLAMGLRGYGSKDLDASESVSSTGESEDRDLWLWRLSTAARFFPLIFPDGIWLGAELGVAFLVDSLDAFDRSGDQTSARWTTQIAPLLGAALGWEINLSEAFILELELRTQLIALGENPRELKREVYSREFGIAPWLGLGVGGAYQW
jgi:hypothetical protein